MPGNAAVEAVLGLDVGTSGTKGLLLSAEGRVLATASAGYPLLTPRPGWTEQAPEDWWQAACTVTRRLLEGKRVAVRGVGLSGQMHGSVFLDAKGQPIRPALLWNDARTGDQCLEIVRRLGLERVIAITGNRPSAGLQAPKVLWLQAHEPEAYRAVRHLLLPKDFIRYRLGGGLATDAADASGTLLLDLASRRYSEEMLAALDIPTAWLPAVHEGPEVTGTVDAAGAAAAGLPAGIPVVAGGGDNACAAIGAGVIAEGQGACSLGTSGTIFVHANRPLIDPAGALNAFCAAVPGGWHSMGVVLSAGGCLRWFRAALMPEAAPSFSNMLDWAEEVPAGADGVLFLPYLAGERSPHMDPAARGAWLGLALAHDRRHMLRGLVEGVGYAFTDCLDRMRSLGADPAEIALVGGGAESVVWRRILAAQLGVALAAAGAAEGPALGAALLAQVGCRHQPDIASAVRAAIPTSAARIPVEPALAEAYRNLHRRWRTAYPTLAAAGLMAP